MLNVSTYSLEARKAPLTKQDLLHLLRRCLLGVGQKEIKFFSGKSLDECLDVLLTQTPAPEPLVLWDSNIVDPLVKEGEIWINAPHENIIIDRVRQGQLKMWWIGQLLNRDFSLTAKMNFFWHNHFALEMDVVKDARFNYRYFMLLRTQALGSFKKIIQEGTTTPAMLTYLNGASNEKAAPNENYSRELMELFTIGKHEKGYTEDDVKAAARVLTGWKNNKEKICSEFHPEFHDTNDKHFSAFFDNKVIKGKEGLDGAKEKDELIDLIFSKKQTALFCCRNFYRWFVSGHIDEAIEIKVIAPLADVMIAANFEVAPVLRTLLGSEHFFDAAFRGCIVKSPIDYFLGAMQQFDVVTSANLDTNHNSWYQFYNYTEDLTLNIGDPPSVAGWPAYYQAPKYHQWWINSASLSMRKKLLDNLCRPDGIIFNGPNIKFDFVHFLSQFESAGNVNSFLDECLELLFAVPVSNESKAKLRELLVPVNTHEQYWAEAWSRYKSNPKDTRSEQFLDEKLRAFVKKLITEPEFQMM